MTPSLAVLCVCLVLGAQASPASRSVRDTWGMISFDFILPGVREVTLDENESTTTTPSTAAAISADDPPMMIFMDPEELFEKRKPELEPEVLFAKAEKRKPEPEPEILFATAEKRKPELEPEVLFATAEKRKPDPEPEVVTEAKEESDEMGMFLFFPTEDRTLNSTNKTVEVTTTTAAATDADEGSGDFVFPSHITLTNKTEEEVPNLSIRNEGNCNFQKRQIMYNGTCEELLSRNTCAEDEWLVLLEDGPKCMPRPCPWGEIPFEDRCVDPTDLSVCDRGQILYIDVTGNSICDCDAGFIYDPYSGNCYARHERGSCNYGEYQDVSPTGKVQCIRNPCHDKYVQDQTTGICYEKQYSGFCENDQILFYQNNRTAECLAVAIRNILDVPELRECPPGSLRDYLDVCRKTFHMPTIDSYPALYGGCPGGFIMDHNGTCRRASRLFG